MLYMSNDIFSSTDIRDIISFYVLSNLTDFLSLSACFYSFSVCTSCPIFILNK